MILRVIFLSIIVTYQFTKICVGQSQLLQIDAKNQHYLNYNSKPQLLISSSEHYGAVINKAFDYKQYLETLSKEGLNYVRIYTGSYIEKVGDFGIQRNTLAPASSNILLPWKRSDSTGFFLGGNKFDLSKWDDDFFKRLKDFVSLAKEKQVIVEVTLFSSYYGNAWKYCPFNPSSNINNTDNKPATLINTLYNGNIIKEQEKYVRKIVRELNDFGNLYFEIQNEPWADQVDTIIVKNDYDIEKKWTSSIQVASIASLNWQSKVSQWIKDEEKSLKNKHLISQNISNFQYPIADKIDNISIYNFHYSLPTAVSENYYLNRPIGNNETGFAGKEDFVYRRQAWRFIMAGGALFNHLDYSFSVGKEKGIDSTYKSPGGGSPKLRAQLGVIKKVFDKIDLTDLYADRTSLVASPGYLSYTLSNNKSNWIIYLESMGIRQQDIILNLPSSKYQVEWIDAKTGNQLTKSTTDGKLLKVPNGNKDKLAIIKSGK